jgi:CheY-like chemotaxis protein
MDPVTERSGRRLRVLIIDCHPAFRIAAKALLETEGLQVDHLEPGNTAEQADPSLQPDVVLIDVCPDRLDGLDLARRFAAIPEPPVIVLMSTVTADELLTSAVGADAFLPKAAVTADGLARAAATAGTR